MSTSGEAKPDPKAANMRAGRRRRYRRHVASAKGWQALHAQKSGPCRICSDPASNGRLHSRIELHHIVSRQDGGDDYAANLVPLCPYCHDKVTRRDTGYAMVLLLSLEDDEYAYAVQRGGENYFERAYGLRYRR